MCMAACYWAGVGSVFYAAQVEDALLYGNFDDSMIYEEIRKPAAERSIPIRQIMRAEAVEVWKKYQAKEDTVQY
jgi:guanine deaminase